MVVTVHQPAFLPWLGYFDKISRSDTYVFLDTVQFEKRGFTHRNKIKCANGATWLTIPVKTRGHMSKTIRDIMIDNTQKWKRRHLNSFFFNYRKAKFFDSLYPELESLYAEQHDFLSDLVYSQLLFWLSELCIDTKVLKSSQLPTQCKKSDLILDLCLKLGATQYLAGSLGRNYLEESAFDEHSIRIDYQDYRHPIYPQLFGEFVPNLSIVDFWMNTRQSSLIYGEQ